MQELRFLVALWLTIAATGAWADTVDSLTVADQTADSIPDEVKMGDGTERVYDLNGRQLNAPVKGINIINGKKVMNR